MSRRRSFLRVGLDRFGGVQDVQRHLHWLYDEAAVARLTELGRRAVAGIAEAIRATGVTAWTTGYGSMFRVHPKPTPLRNYRETYPTAAEETARKLLVDALYEEGVVVFSPCTVTLSTPMGDAEVDALVDAFETFTKVD